MATLDQYLENYFEEKKGFYYEIQLMDDKKCSCTIGQGFINRTGIDKLIETYPILENVEIKPFIVHAYTDVGDGYEQQPIIIFFVDKNEYIKALKCTTDYYSDESHWDYYKI